MNCCRCNCAYISVIVAILAGVLLGVLYALGFVVTGLIFWAYLAIGVAAILLAPIYATGASCQGNCRCFARYRRGLLGSAIATVIAAGIGLIVAFVSSVPVIAIALSIATFTVVLLLGLLVCLANCLTES